jgi:hypothetical protein
MRMPSGWPIRRRGRARTRDVTRMTRLEAARFAASARAAAGKSGLVDTTGSWLFNEALNAAEAQKAVDNLTLENEGRRRELFYEGALQRNQSVLAGINVTGQQVAGLAAAQKATTDAAKARLEMYSQRASASAMRTQATGQLAYSIGGLGLDAYKAFKNSPALT